MRFKSLTVCETCLVDGRTNTLSFINILEEINLTTAPAMIHKVNIIAMIGLDFPGEAASVPLEVTVGLNNEQILAQPITVDFNGRQDTRFVLEISGVPVKGPGIMKYGVNQNGKEVLSYYVRVHMNQGQDQLVTRAQ